MAKNRRKKRRKRQGGQVAVPPPPRPSRARNQGAEPRLDAVVATVAAEQSITHKVGDIVSGTVTAIDDNSWIWLDVEGWNGAVIPQELNLADGESARERYTLGETIDGLFAWKVDHEARRLSLSQKRNAPGYLEALQQRAVGDVVFGTITEIANNGGLQLDVDGLVGSVAPDELVLSNGESAQDRYTIGEAIDGLFVWQINHNPRDLSLSVKRNAPGYLEALQRLAVGDVVSGTITDFQPNGGLWLDVNGLVGVVGPQELGLTAGEPVQERYAVGETINGLFVWMIDHDDRHLSLSVKRNAPGYVKALQQRAVGDVVSGTITVFASGGSLWLDVDGLVGNVAPDELALNEGESAREHYTVGETIEGLFVWGIDHEDRHLALSLKRGAPGYAEALRRHVVGEVVSATITGFNGDDDLWLDVDGLVGGIPSWELTLADGESARDRYAVGETIDGLFVWDIDHQTHHLGLSVKRNASGYVEALQRHAVGEVVSATITGFNGDDGLMLDINGLVGGIPPWEIVLADGESTRDRYAVGQTIDGLFVWQVNPEFRVLALSVKRNAPDYAKALQRRSVGDVVSATITDFEGSGGLWLDVDGQVGGVGPEELVLADGESARERYAVGETIEGLFVWGVDHNARGLALSLKRNAPGYLEALQRRVDGEAASGPILLVHTTGLAVEVYGLFGLIPASELPLEAGQSPQQQYSVGETIAARVWMIDRVSRMVILSARRTAADVREEEPIAQGATIHAVVRGATPRDVRMPIRVLTMYSGVDWVEIPPHELSLSTGMPPRFQNDQVIRVVVVELDDGGRATRLSHRLALDDWEAEMQRLSPGALVPNARPVPPVALSEAELRAGTVAVDLGPITGFVPEEELDPEAGQNVAAYNETYPVVIESVDRERGIAIVSHDRFEERWRELAAGFEVGGEVEGELRDFDGEIALLDLGSGLLAQMSERELPDSDPPGKAVFDRISERFSLRITAIDHDSQAIHIEPRDRWAEALLDATESETLEFKAVLRGSGGKSKRRDMTHEAMRTITGFLNTSGGNLVIGVNDDLEVVGLESDDGLAGETMAKKIDSAIQTLEDNMKNVQPLNAFDDRDNLRDLVTWTTPVVRGRTLLVVECQRGPDGGVWLVGKGQPQFWIRQGQETVQRHGRDAILAHLRDRGQRSTASDSDE